MELKLEDLLTKCENCKGEGKIPFKPERSGSGYGQSRVIFATPEECSKCRGKGFILTESGKTLLEFLQMNNVKFDYR